MAEKIDFTLIPTDEELVQAEGAIPGVLLYDACGKALEAGMKDMNLVHPLNWGEIKWLSTYVFTAAYILGVRNERKRAKGKKKR